MRHQLSACVSGGSESHTGAALASGEGLHMASRPDTNPRAGSDARNVRDTPNSEACTKFPIRVYAHLKPDNV
jgi:hypothetical protein